MGEEGALGSLYDVILRDYLIEGSEADLYSALNLGKICVEEEIGPDEIVGLHLSSIKKLVNESPQENLSKLLLKSINLLVEVMVAYGLSYREYQEAKIQHQQLEQELKIAKKIQKSLLPRQLPQIEGIDLGARMIPAKEVGGDYYNLLAFDEHNLGVWIGDVSGKSIPAALLISMLKYALHAFISKKEMYAEPKNLITHLNNLICNDIDPDCFITLFYSYIDIKSGEFLFTNGGHEPVIHFCKDRMRCDELRTDGLVLGVIKDQAYEQKKRTFSSGDILVFYTDGVTESRDGEGNHFGVSRLKAMITKNADLTAQDLVDRLINYVLNHSQMKYFDDITLVVVKKK
ncbi:MAG: PP2C family protein-serine/threonine phosphatase [Candidatus Eremiobacterota bacterium]